jgi:hypothetical protein
MSRATGRAAKSEPAFCFLHVGAGPAQCFLQQWLSPAELHEDRPQFLAASETTQYAA